MANNFFPSFYTFHPNTYCQTISYRGKAFLSNHKDETKAVQQDVKKIRQTKSSKSSHWPTTFST